VHNIQRICVCGAGTMGSGIAQTAARSGIRVILFDVNSQVLLKSQSLIEAAWDKLAEKQKLTTEETAIAKKNIVYTTRLEDCKAEVIIEAIIESQEAKTALFRQLYTLNNEAVIFATNTSSISITAIAGDEPFAANVAGMHFFNPAPVMKLVEVISAKQTSDTTIATILQLAKQMNKIPVRCNDSPGFIVNRIARPYYLEAMRLAEQHHITYESIDQIMESVGFKMGPFKLMDMIGLDINYSVSEIVWKNLGMPERLTPSSLQKEKIQKGTLGKKTGEGFYRYS